MSNRMITNDPEGSRRGFSGAKIIGFSVDNIKLCIAHVKMHDHRNNIFALNGSVYIGDSFTCIEFLVQDNALNDSSYDDIIALIHTYNKTSVDMQEPLRKPLLARTMKFVLSNSDASFMLHIMENAYKDGERHGRRALQSDLKNLLKL